MPPFIHVDSEDGSVKLPELGLALGKGLPQSSVELMLADFWKGARDHGNGYSWVNFSGLTFGGAPCGLAVGFHHSALTQSFLSVFLPDMELEDGWPTREAIDKEIAFVRKTLWDQLGRKFGDKTENFTWGVAWCSYDPKAGVASSGVRYS